MSIFSDIMIFALVLAFNLLLVGAILAGGIALVFKFTESIAPRFRYFAAVAIFLLAVLFPLAEAIKPKNDVVQQQGNTQIAEKMEQKNAADNLAMSEKFSDSQNNEFDLAITDKKSSNNVLSDFIARFGNSFYGKTFFSLWLLGAALLLTREIVGLRQLKKARNSWTPATDTQREILECTKTTRLFFAENQTPGTVGLFRPVIVLPTEFPDEISLESKRFIVRHELAHARAFDPLGSFLVRTIRNLFWISPALWLLETLIEAEREATADRAALSRLPHNKSSEKSALNYAETLLQIAQTFNENNRKSRQPQLIGINSGSDLEIRIRRLLSSERLNFRQTASALSACLLTALVIAAIPLAAFPESDGKSYLGFASMENYREMFPVENKTIATSFQNDDNFLTQVEIDGKYNNPNQSEIGVKNEEIENSLSSESNSKDGMGQIEEQNLKSVDKNNVDISAKILNERDAGEAKSGENQHTVVQSNSFKPLPASSSLKDESNTPQEIRSARNSRSALPDASEVPRPKDPPDASEASRPKDARELGRQSYPADYPAARAIPEREIYETKYVPYPARRSKQ